MAHVVEQRCRGHHRRFVGGNAVERAAVPQVGQRAPGQMIRAQRVLEPRMRRARIHEVRQAQLSHVTQALHDGRIEQSLGDRVNPDVVPEWVADEGHA